MKTKDLFLLLFSYVLMEVTDSLQVGDEVCTTNYIMDAFCINRGTLLDNPDVVTLENPEKHSFHCLLDVPLCRDSGYLVLGDKDEETGLHCLGFRLNDTQAVLEAGTNAGRQGYCTDCLGDASKPEFGYTATVKGSVIALGDGSDTVSGTPILGNVQILDDSVGCEITTVSNICTAPAPAPASTPAGSVKVDDTPNTPVSMDCTLQFCEKMFTENYRMNYKINIPDDTTPEECKGCTITVELIYTGDPVWLAVGISADGDMVPGNAVIGFPDQGSIPLKYNLTSMSNAGVQPMPEDMQTLTDAIVERNDLDQTTTMKFTKIMNEPGETEITFGGDNNFIWAHGSSPTLGYHNSRASVRLNLSSGSSEALVAPNMAAWFAHGILGLLAWGVLVPFAVQSSLLRDLLPQGPTWFHLHRAFNTGAYALFIVLFAIAVHYTNQEGRDQFNGSHQRMGLAMFILVSFQVFGGVLRPHLPVADSKEEKTTVRKGWEVGHRLLGVALLACGFWQIWKGIQLYSIKYSVSESDEDKVMIAYWVWIGLMSAIIVLGGGYYKFKNATSSKSANGDKNGADPTGSEVFHEDVA